MNSNIVIIGGGHAAAQLCAGLVEAGQGARIHLVCEEAAVPYHRPPLSKTILKSPEEVPQQHRAEGWYAEAGITLHLGDAAQAIDRKARTVKLRSGAVLEWDRLVLATGTRARRISALEGLENVALLRAAHEAVQLRDKLAAAQHVTVLGGGFIGLEVAATALALGKQVLVLESASRLLGRAVSPDLSAHVLATHRAAGMDIRVGVKTDVLQVDGHHLTAIEIDGQPQPIDLLLLGIGAVPAIGDCTLFPDQRSDTPLRLESVQNANDQARTAVATLTGARRPHAAVPWFWSDQGSLRLQMAGLVPAPGTPGALTVRRPGANAASFSLLHYVGAQLRCVESVNAPVDHMMSRKLLEAGRSPEPAVAADPAVPLKSLLA